jgi:hypothetical protein
LCQQQHVSSAVATAGRFKTQNNNTCSLENFRS